MNGKHLTKLRKGMVIKFPDEHIEVILGTGYIGKSDKFPHKKGRHYIFTDEAMYFWGVVRYLKMSKFLVILIIFTNMISNKRKEVNILRSLFEFCHT